MMYTIVLNIRDRILSFCREKGIADLWVYASNIHVGDRLVSNSLSTIIVKFLIVQFSVQVTALVYYISNLLFFL